MTFQNDILAGTSANQGVSAAFDGNPASGYTAWWRSDTGVDLSGSLVDKWTDKAGSDFTVVPHTGFSVDKLTYIASDEEFNNKPSLGSTSNDQHQYISEGQNVSDLLTDNNDWHIWVVALVNTSHTNYSYPEMWGCTSGYGWIGPGSSTSFKAKNGGITLSGTSLGTLYVLEWINNSSGSFELKATSSSGTLETSTTKYTWGPGYGSDYTMWGGVGSSGMTFFGKMSELIFYNAEQTGGDLTTLQGYFEDNYAVSFD